jgi:ABC-2 type transport system permease protein
MKALRIAEVGILRMLRDRQGLFFVFALPVVIIVVFGLAFGGSGAREIGVADEDRTPFSVELIAAIDTTPGSLEIRTYATIDALRDAVQRNVVDIGLAIPAGFGEALLDGDAAAVEYVARPEVISSAVRPILDDAVGREVALVKAARFAAERRGIKFGDALADVRALQVAVGGMEVSVESSGDPLIEPGMNGYLMGAQSQLVLFMFMTSMTAATALIVSRQLGVSRRMFSTPTSAATIMLGETLGRFGVAMIQGLFILVGTAVVFGVSWGDPLAAGVVVVIYGLVGTGVAMLVGSIASNPEQAGSAGVGVAMLLGAFGGAMVPPEVFPDIMRTLSFATPHAWAIDAFRDLALRDADLVAILPQLGVLLAFAVVLIGLATIRFRRALVG